MPPSPANEAWRDGESYAELLRLDRSGFAWEWLRRDPAYCEAAREAMAAGAGRQLHSTAADPRAAIWGLHAFEAPELAAPEARPVWRREHYPFVLPVAATHRANSADEDLFNVDCLRPLATILIGGGCAEHLLLSDGFHSLRLDVTSGGLAAGPALLSYQLVGFVGIEPPLLVLRQFLALWRTGSFSQSLHPREARATRWVTLLRVHDALAVGANQREIAAMVLDGQAGEPRWRVNAPTVRSRVQRLVRSARRMAQGGHWLFFGQ